MQDAGVSDSGKTTEAEAERAGGATLLSLTVEEGPQVKGRRQPLLQLLLLSRSSRVRLSATP